MGDKIRYFGTENRFKIIYIDHELQWVLFYVDKNICSFDPLKISSDKSNISKILCLVRTFYKNTLIKL